MTTPDPNYHPTDADLVDAIVANAAKAGFTLDECRGIILAEMANGILRANCPRWLRQTQYFLARHGKLYPDGLVAKAAAAWLDHPAHLAEMGLDRQPGAHRGAPD